MTKVSEKSPFAKELLVRDDCFILDNGANGKIFVWKGEESLIMYTDVTILPLIIISGIKS